MLIPVKAFQDRIEFSAYSGFYAEWRTMLRMLKDYGYCIAKDTIAVKTVLAKMVMGSFAIFYTANNRVPDVFHMPAQLMPSASPREKSDKKITTFWIFTNLLISLDGCRLFIMSLKTEFIRYQHIPAADSFIFLVF